MSAQSIREFVVEKLGKEFPLKEEMISYLKRFKVIKNLTQMTYTNVKFGFEYDSNFQEFCVNLIEPQRACYTGKIDAEWNTIKKDLDKLISLTPSIRVERDCPVCYECISCGFGCITCNEILCFKCHYKITIRGRGIFKCPFCREESGEIRDSEEIVDEAQHNLDRFCDKAERPRITITRVYPE